MSSRVWRAGPAGLFVLLAFVPSPARSAEPSPCNEHVDRSNLVSCAAQRSPLLEAEQANVRAAKARREAARPFLPSNPILSGSIGTRTTTDARAVNWALTLAQEFEVAGQSSLRVDAADGELASAQAELLVRRAELAERVWLAYFDVLAAREHARLAERMELATMALSRTVQGMRANGLAAPVDSTIAEAARVRTSRERLNAQQTALQEEVRLRTELSVPVTVEIAGVLDALQWKATGKPTERPEVTVVKSLRLAWSKRIELLRRARAPNPSVSVFAQNDGFNERVFGVGLGVPIPLPQPVGRTNAGEIAEAMSFEEKQVATLRQLELTLAAELEVSQAAFESSRKVVQLYSEGMKAEANGALIAISEQVGSGRFSVREALTVQQSLIELLEAEVDARHALAVASVRLVRAQGGSLEGGDL